MVKRTASAPNEEPVQQDFDKPSEQEHLLQVADIFTKDEHPDGFEIDDPDTAIVKAEVVGGEEEGRSMLIQCTLDDSLKKFYYTRMFLKAIGCKYKGDNFPIDSDEWQGRQFFATVEHNKGKNDKVYANIKEYNFDKMIDHSTLAGSPEVLPADVDPTVNWEE